MQFKVKLKIRLTGERVSDHDGRVARRDEERPARPLAHRGQASDGSAAVLHQLAHARVLKARGKGTAEGILMA